MPPQQLSSEGRARVRSAANMLPGINIGLGAGDAMRGAENAANTRMSPEAAAQRAAAARVARLQTMHQSLLAQGNQAEADQVGAILQSLQMGGKSMGQVPASYAPKMNAFAGMGSGAPRR